MVTGLVVTTRVTITGAEPSERFKSVAALSTKPAPIPSFSATVTLTIDNGKRGDTFCRDSLNRSHWSEDPRCGFSGTQIRATWTSETTCLLGRWWSGTPTGPAQKHNSPSGPSAAMAIVSNDIMCCVHTLVFCFVEVFGCSFFMRTQYMYFNVFQRKHLEHNSLHQAHLHNLPDLPAGLQR